MNPNTLTRLPRTKPVCLSAAAVSDGPAGSPTLAAQVPPDRRLDGAYRAFLGVGLSGLLLLVFALHCFGPGHAAAPTRMATEDLAQPPARDTADWLIAPARHKAGLYRGEDGQTLVLENGLVRRIFRLSPNLGCVALDQLSTGESYLRAVRPEAEITLNGRAYPIGGLTNQPVQNYLLPDWLSRLGSVPGSFRFAGFTTNTLQPRFAWKKRASWLSQDRPWPPPGVAVTFHFQAPENVADEAIRGLFVQVHYELYDGLPLMAKWLTVSNAGPHGVSLGTFRSEWLACVEAASEVEELVRPPLPNLHVETDFTTVAMSGEAAQRQTVRWLPDASYGTQVNYLLKTPCLLSVEPPLGPALALEPGQNWESFRTWILAHDSTDQARRTLALCRMYRTIAPWGQENPLIMHVRSARPEAVRLAIDQAADVGFELVIMTFGSGFDIENEAPDYLARIRELADYAHRKGIALGGYSLLASRSVSADDDVINPATGKPGGFATFGNSPCLGSRWGEDYFRKLYRFYDATGCDVLEHDGSYPGDACASTNHPGHRHHLDSRWRQWEIISRFYRWCRGQGIYLNVPDWHFLNGSSKTGMGYRETNWSLPREQQELIERQNIFDGTRFKTPSMGWMFVPLTEYHGGGAAATIEPLHEHRDHYGRRLANLLGAGVQACFRGPRLYDTAETRAVVVRWVSFYRQHRAILDSDLLPLRRADGRDWDGWIHVNPALATRALAVIYNPLDRPIERTVRLPLYYTGLTNRAVMRIQDGPRRRVRLDRDYSVQVPLALPARDCTWVSLELPERSNR
jgi:hypothetical protein